MRQSSHQVDQHRSKGTKWVAAGIGLAAAAYAAYVGVTWYRYGTRTAPRDAESDALLDDFMPAYEIAERHHIRVAAPAALTRRSAILAVVLSTVVAMWIGTRRQRSALAADTERLIRAGAAHTARPATGDQVLADLPAPVARYLRLALPLRKQIQDVRITQTGMLRTDATAERWMAFTAEHLAVPAATGFLWNARVQVAPMLHVRVRDALIDGIGSGQVSLLSAFTVSAATGGVEMNSGSLHRYLAEAVWYPTALLPSSHLQWTHIDATRALATLTNDRASVSLEFRFANSGEVAGIYTPARWGTFAGGYKQVEWEGHFRDYRERDGIVVPTYGEVGWYIDGEWRPVWKGAVAAYHLRNRQ